jgi:cellulose synthase/poly-beta-1,6-N-acetylglucosamine synthase-like glycosyltransferase
VAPLTWVVIAALIFISARRFVLLGGALLSGRLDARRVPLPSVLVAVSARNEAPRLEPLLNALERLDYPRDLLSVVLVDDGSTDETARLFTTWCERRPGSLAMTLTTNVGKASALNAALAVAPAAELVAVYDADQRPRPDSLRLLAAAFHAPGVGAASGYRLPSNADTGMVSRYAALESWVHQLVVQRGKDRLRLNPTTMGGNCAYRVAALRQVGGFPAGAFSEDVEVSLALVARGWQTVFVDEAVAEHEVSGTLRAYLSQRSRWTWGLYHAGWRARGPESAAVAAGYADRLVFASGCLLALAGLMSPAWLGLYLAAPALESVAALGLAGRLARAPLYLLSAVPMFVVDIGLTAAATLLALARRRPQWG